MYKEKCRICLGNRKNMISIFSRERAISYADMMSILANVKIVQDDRITNRICRQCQKKLVEAYEFRVLIENSDTALYKATNTKKINFTNINDIKIKIEIEPVPIPKCEEVKEYFKDGEDEVFYNDTVIKKLHNSEDGLVITGKPIPVLDFLKTIKDEPCSDTEDNNMNENFDPGNCSTGAESDEDYNSSSYLIPTPRKNKNKRRFKKCDSNKKLKVKSMNNNKENQGQMKQVCIKPVILKDLKYMISARTQKHNKKKVYHHRQEMCPHCGKMTRTLKTHILVHTGERKFKCDICEKSYFTEANLSKHKLSHSNTKDFACDHCIAAFSGKGALKSHMRTHIEIKCHICDICSKAFKRLSTLQRHKMMHNSANKSIMCELCNMSFYTKGALTHHMRVHTGERPYNCEICSQPYSYKHDFNRHCFKKHGVFLKRRSVYVMNEEVLKKERVLMRDLLLRVNGVIKDGKPINPFEGPQAALAFELAVKALESRQIPIEGLL